MIKIKWLFTSIGWVFVIVVIWATSFMTGFALTPNHIIYNRLLADYLALRQSANSPPLSAALSIRLRLSQNSGEDKVWLLSTSDIHESGLPIWICDAYIQHRWWLWQMLSGGCRKGTSLPHDPLVLLGWWETENTSTNPRILYGLLTDKKITKLVVHLNNGQSILGRVQDDAFVVSFPLGVEAPEDIQPAGKKASTSNPIVPAAVDALDSHNNLLYHSDFIDLTPLRGDRP